MATFEILDHLTDVADSSRLQDRIKVCKSQRLIEELEALKNLRLIADLEALGEREYDVRCLDHIREIVARDCAKLRVLEQLLAGTHVRIDLKDSYVADMEENE
ncbi:hypothetical protein Tco_0489380 [Tanacetum coccineum]